MTTVKFINEKQVSAILPDGQEVIIGYLSHVNYIYETQYNCNFLAFLKDSIDECYSKSEQSLYGFLQKQSIKHRFDAPDYFQIVKAGERLRIGRRIKELREKRGLEAKKLAELCGVDAGNISRIENGRVSVGLDVLARIAAALKTKIEFVDF